MRCRHVTGSRESPGLVINCRPLKRRLACYKFMNILTTYLCVKPKECVDEDDTTTNNLIWNTYCLCAYLCTFQVAEETLVVVLDEAPSKCEKTPGEEEESGEQVTLHPGPSPIPFPQEQQREEQHLKSVVRTVIYSICIVCHYSRTSLSNI